MTVFSRMYPYYTIEAAPIFEDSLISMAALGLAYRGTPDDPRVKVGEIRSPQEVVLISCPKDSPTDPYVQYTKANGQPVPPSSSPAYQKTITMIESGGTWKISDIYSDKSVVCEG